MGECIDLVRIFVIWTELRLGAELGLPVDSGKAAGAGG